MVPREDSPTNGSGSIGSSYFEVSGEHREVTANIQALLCNFKQGKRHCSFTVSSRSICLPRVSSLHAVLS